MVEPETISVVAVILTAFISIISLYFRSKYNLFKEAAKEFVDTVIILVDMIEDDKITEDEIKDVIIHVKHLVNKVNKFIIQLRI